MARVGDSRVTGPTIVRFEMPMLPPSVNHLTEHPATGVHPKSAAAKAFMRDFPIFARDLYAMSASGIFQVTLCYFPGKGQRGDSDNYNKLILDCAAKRGMFRNAKGKELSDAWVKRLIVEIYDSLPCREIGPKTIMTIEAIECLTMQQH